jgi:excinuclease UvrABC ATPase subunit
MTREGFVRACVNGEPVDTDAPPELDNTKLTIEVVIDRLEVRDDPGARGRMAA